MPKSSGLKTGLAARDLISAGIFTALFCIVLFIFAMILSGIPVVSLFTSCADALLGGVIFMFLALKVRKPGALAIMSFLVGLFMFVAGHFWLCLVFGAVFGAAADFLCSRGGYTKFIWNTLGYVVFCLALTLKAYTPMLFFAEEFIETRTRMGMSEEYIRDFLGLTRGPLLIAAFAGTVACAVLGAFFARGLLKKHFQRAGAL
jgi:energy-coupling factor transport system substrate-specific component